MSNELLLIGSLFIIFGGTLLFYYLFGKQGLYCWTVLATLLANIEVLILVRAFGLDQTLGNVLFASTFLVTDILSEVYGKKASQKAVNIGILTSIAFIILSQYWLLYTPSSTDWAMPSIKSVFSNTPRLIFASLIVYAICQRFDVWAYHKWWQFTEKLSGDRKKYLWLRNNGSTLISQLLNSILYTCFAFGGMYEWKVIPQLILATYVVFVVTSLADTPIIYLARIIKPRNEES